MAENDTATRCQNLKHEVKRRGRSYQPTWGGGGGTTPGPASQIRSGYSKDTHRRGKGGRLTGGSKAKCSLPVPHQSTAMMY